MEQPKPSRRRAAVLQAMIGMTIVVTTVIQGIVFIPYIIRTIGNEQYGFWLAIQGIAAFGSVFDLGIASLVSQRISASFGRSDSTNVLRYYSTGLALQLRLWAVSAIVGALLVIGSCMLFVQNDQFDKSLYIAFALSWICGGMVLVSNGQKNVADALQQPLRPLLHCLFGALVSITLLVLNLNNGLGIVGLAHATLVGESLVLLLNLVHARKLSRSFGSIQHPDPATQSELLVLSPSLSFAKITTAVAARIEPTIINALLGPTSAVSYSVSKKGAEVILIVLDRLVASVRAGFAHLVGEGQSEKIRSVFQTISGFYSSVALVLAFTYIAANSSFTSLWVGSSQYAGDLTTIANAAGVVMIARHNLYSVLLGETGDIKVPALMVGIESGVRVVAMFGLGSLLGILGVAISTPLSCAAFSLWHKKRLERKLAYIQRGSVRRKQLLAVVVLSSLVWIEVRFGPKHLSWIEWSLYALSVCTCALLVAISTNRSAFNQVRSLLR
jgi:O-antigen/teichoic acid export membrane protein